MASHRMKTVKLKKIIIYTTGNGDDIFSFILFIAVQTLLFHFETFSGHSFFWLLGKFILPRYIFSNFGCYAHFFFFIVDFIFCYFSFLILLLGSLI